MIDPRIPMMGQSPDMIEAVNSGFADGGNFAKLLIGSQVNRMRDIEDPTQRQAFAKNNFFGRQLRAQLKEDEVAQAQALREQQKHDADIYNTLAQGGERIANAGKTTQETTVNRQRAMSSALAAAMRGDPRAANFMLEHGKTGGIIDDASYEQAKQFLTTNANNPEAISSLVESLGVTAAEKPEQYIQPDANTVANNITSRANNEATVEATLAGQQVQKEIADDKLDLEKLIQQQREARANGEFETMQGEDGITYAVYKSGLNAGKVEPLRIESGELFKQKAKNKLDSGALKQVNEYNSQLVQAKASQVKIGGLLKDLKSGTLNLSPQAIIAAEGRARIGQSTPGDLAIGRFNTAMNQAVNDVLMAAKGTQTEGDAQRAAQVIAANPPRDNAAALQALQSLALIAKTNINALEGNLNTIYANFGMERPQPKANPPQASNKQPTSGKVYTSAMVQQYAKSSGRSIEEITRKIKESGGVIR